MGTRHQINLSTFINNRMTRINKKPKMIVNQKRFLHTLLFLLSLNCLSTFALNSELSRVKINHQLPRLEGNITVDAILDESIWQQALKIELTIETHPAENTPSPVTTVAYLFENGETLFVGFVATDPDPSAIKNFLTDRDKLWESDFVGIKFDTFGESKKAFQFFVNALGVQADSTQEDFRGDNVNWDAIWDSAGKITETGYVVEIAIPFSALRFPEKDVEQTWAVEILRFYPREYRHRIANTPVNRDISCNICQFDNLVGFANAKPSQNIRLVPTLVVGRTDEKNISSAHWNNGEIDNEFGLDFRWGITQDIYLNATINPDFSQVEADSPQLDINNPFSIFVAEKRPFFLDGGDYFETINQLVNTRNIIAPEYGVKLTGQTDGHSFALMAIDDEHTSFLLPKALGSGLVNLANQSSNNQIIRYAYDLGNKNTLGVLNTQRSGNDYNNQMTALDGKYWFDQYHSINIQYMSSTTHNPESLVSDADYADFNLQSHSSGEAYTVNFSHNSRNWWGYFDYLQYDKDFRADLGFISRADYAKTIIGVGHRWFPVDVDSWWKEIDLDGDWDVTYDNAGKKLEEELEMNFFVRGKYLSEISSGLGERRQFWNEEYFNENYYYLNGSFQPLSGLKLFLGLNWGNSIDFANTQLGEHVRIRPQINWQIHQNWLASFEYEHLDFDVPAGDLFTARLTNFRLTYQFSTRSFLRYSLQRTDISQYPQQYFEPVDSTIKNLSTQLLYTYKINPQTLFFAGYSDSGYQDDLLNKIEKNSRSIFLKFSYAWQK